MAYYYSLDEGRDDPLDFYYEPLWINGSIYEYVYISVEEYLSGIVEIPVLWEGGERTFFTFSATIKKKHGRLSLDNDLVYINKYKSLRCKKSFWELLEI
jgi:hypothetical protein